MASHRPVSKNDLGTSRWSRITEPIYKWLVLEALVPLFGAALLFLLWGMSRYFATSAKPFKYPWTLAFDPMGWLYGGAVLAFQAGLKGIGLREAGVLPFICWGTASISLVLLVAAMTERGESDTWKPPRRLIIAAILLVAMIVSASLHIQKVVLKESRHAEPDRTQQES